MISAPRTLAVALLLLHLVLFGRAHGQQQPPLTPPTSSMPSPALLPDPGARCSGWLVCPTIGEAELAIILYPWYASPVPGVRDEAGGLHAALDLDLYRHFELGLQAGMLTWMSAAKPAVRSLGWNLVGGHLRGAVQLGGLWLVGDYSHQYGAGSVGLGLLQPGGSLGRGTGAVYLSLLDGAVTLGASGAVAYAPQLGAAAAEAGIRAALVPPDPGHHVTLYIEGGARKGVSGPGGGLGGWASVGFSGVSREGGTEMGGGILVGHGDQVPLILIGLRLGEHLGPHYTPFRLWSKEPEPDEPPPPPGARQPPPPAVPLGGPPGPAWSPLWPPAAPPPSCALVPCLGLPAGLQFPPGLWYPPGVDEPPPGPHAPKGAMTAYLERQQHHHVFGQIARPPVRPPLPPMPRTGLRAERGVEGEPDQRDRVEDEGGSRLVQVRREASRRAAEAPSRGEWEPVRDADREGPALRPQHAEHAAPGTGPVPAPRATEHARPPSAEPAREQAPFGLGGPPPWERPAPQPAVAEHAPPPPLRNQPPASTGAVPPAQALSSGTTRGGAGPVRQGQAGVATVVKQLQQPGRQVDTEITLKTSQGPRRIDVLVTETNGQRTAYEVKTGNSPYKPIQVSKDDEMATQGATPTGKRAAAAGLGNGPVQIPTKLIRLK